MTGYNNGMAGTGMSLAEANARVSGPAAKLLDGAHVTVKGGKVDKKPGAGNGATPVTLDGFSFPEVANLGELAEQQKAEDMRTEFFKAMSGLMDTAEGNHKMSVPAQIVKQVSGLFLAMTGNQDSSTVSTNKAQHIAALNSVLSLAFLGKERLALLTLQQRRELKGIACSTAFKEVVDLALGNTKPSYEWLSMVNEALLKIGALREPRLVDKKFLDENNQEVTIKADNLKVMQGRVVWYGHNKGLVIEARAADVADHWGRYQAAWTAVQDQYKAEKTAEIDEFAKKATTTIAKVLDGTAKKGVVVLNALRTTRMQKNRDTGQMETAKDPFGHAAFQVTKEKDGSVFVTPVAWIGMMRRLDRIAENAKSSGQLRGFFVEDLAKIDPRNMVGNWDSVCEKVHAVPAPVGAFIKNPTDEQKAFHNDQKVLWGYLVRAMTYAFSPQSETASMRLETDIHVRQWVDGEIGRTVMFEAKSPDRIVFAVTRSNEGFSFEFPSRLKKSMFADVEPGTIYQDGDVPNSIASAVQRIVDRINGVGEEKEAGACEVNQQ